MTPLSIDISQLSFSALWTTNKGAKQLPALYENGEPVIWQPDDSLEVPFEPSSYADPDAIRVTLSLNPTESVCETITQIEEWCIATLSKNPTTLFGCADDTGAGQGTLRKLHKDKRQGRLQDSEDEDE